jgi:hypothetical protein
MRKDILKLPIKFQPDPTIGLEIILVSIKPCIMKNKLKMTKMSLNNKDC